MPSRTNRNAEDVTGVEQQESTTGPADNTPKRLRSLVPLLENHIMPTEWPFLQREIPALRDSRARYLHMLSATSLARANLPEQVRFQQSEFTFRYRGRQFYQTDDAEDYERVERQLYNWRSRWDCLVENRWMLGIHMYGSLTLPLQCVMRSIFKPHAGAVWRRTQDHNDALLPDYALVREGHCCGELKPGSMLACVRFEVQHEVGNEEMEKIFTMASEYSLQPVFDDATGTEIPSMLCADESPRSRGRRRRRTVGLEMMYHHNLRLAMLTNLCVWLVFERDGDVITVSKLKADDAPNSEGLQVMLDLAMRALEPDLEQRLRFP